MANENQSPLNPVDNDIIPPLSRTVRAQLARLGRNWGWLLAAGICFVALGVAAYVWPVSSTISITLGLGVLFVIGGFIRVAEALQLRNEIGSGWRVFDAFLCLAAGILLLRFPGAGMVAITMALVFFFFMSATAKTVFAYSTRPLPGSGWAFVSAMVSLGLGIYMIATFPISALWIPGALLGIEFVIYGVCLIGFSFSVRKLHHEAQRVIEKPTEARRAA